MDILKEKLPVEFIFFVPRLNIMQGERVGLFPSVAEAAKALHRDPNALNQIDTGDDATLLAKKRELYAIIAHLAEVSAKYIRQQRKGNLYSKLGIGITTLPTPEKWNWREALPQDLGHTMFQEIHGEEFFEQDYFGAISTLRFKADSNDTDHESALFTLMLEQVFEADDFLPITERARNLMNDIKAPVYERYDNIKTTSGFLAAHIVSGFNSASKLIPALLRALPQAIAAKQSDVTYDEMMEIARKSVNLARSPAGMNVTQMVAFFGTLHTPKADFDSYIKENIPPERVIDPSYLEFDPERGNVKFETPVSQLRGRLDQDGQIIVEKIKEFKHDSAGIESREGCPARLEMEPGSLSPVAESWFEFVDLAAHYWHLAIPSRKPMPLPDIDLRQPFHQLNLDDLRGIHVQILPSATGQTSIELSDDGLAQNLEVSATEDGELKIRGIKKPMVETPLPTMTIRLPQPPGKVFAQDCDSLEIEYAHKFNVVVPEGGSLRANASGADNTVTAWGESDALIFCHKATDVVVDMPDRAWKNPPLIVTRQEAERSIPVPQGARLVALQKATPQSISSLPSNTQGRLSGAVDFLTRHWGPNLRDAQEVYDKISSLNKPKAAGRSGGLLSKRNVARKFLPKIFR